MAVDQRLQRDVRVSERVRVGRDARADELLDRGGVEVADYQIPDDVTVVFLSNPFTGQTFTRVLDHLLASVDRNPRSLRVIYFSPREHHRLMATRRIQLAKRIRRPRPTREWASRAAIHVYDVLPEPTREAHAVTTRRAGE